MNEQKRAIGYVCDVPVTGTDMIISKEDQRARLLKYAKNEGIELVHIFEDDVCTRDYMNRPGLRKVLAVLQEYDTVLVERVWVLTRKKKELGPFFKKIENRGGRLVATTYLWDYLHQMLRRRNRGMVTRKAASVMENARRNIVEMKPVHVDHMVYTQGANVA